MQACEQAKVPRVLIWCIRSKRLSGVSTVPARKIALALFTRMSIPRRTVIAYLMTDQAYVVSVTDWAGTVHDDSPPTLARRFAFYTGAGLTLWGSWQLSTIVGALAGTSLPDSVPLTFAVPLVFLVLLIPTLSSTPSVVAALVGGAVTVLGLEVGVGSLSVMVGAVAGIIAAAIVDTDEGPDAGGSAAASADGAGS